MTDNYELLGSLSIIPKPSGVRKFSFIHFEVAAIPVGGLVLEPE
jgi:hypothetical protein